MLESALRPQYKMRINVRPVKHAYFVHEDDTESLMQAIRLMGTQWGGIRSLIVPIRSDHSIAPEFEYLLQFHEPDQFIGYLAEPSSQDREAHDRVQEYLFGLWPHKKVSLSMGCFFERHDHTAHALTAIPDEELAENQLTNYEFSGTPEDRLILLALFGSIFPGQEEYYADTVDLGQRGMGLDQEDFWEAQLSTSPFASVLNLTGYGVAPYKATGGLYDSNHFDVVLVDSPTSLCMYWNFRATREATQFRAELGRRTILFPERLLADDEALRRMVTCLRARLPHPGLSSNLDIRFCVWDEAGKEKLERVVAAVEKLTELADDTVSVRHNTSAQGTPVARDYSAGPLTYQFLPPSYPDAYWEGVRGQIAYNTELNYGRNEVFFNPPAGFRNRGGGMVCIDFECDVWRRYPCDQRIGEKIRSSSWFSRYGLTLVVGIPDRPHYVDFYLPREWETLALYFLTRGYRLRVSRPGLYASALVKLLGGFQSVGLLASKPAYLLLDALALKSTKKLAQRILRQLELRADQVLEIQPLLEDLEVVPELKRVPKTYRQLCDGPLQSHRQGLLALLDRLSDRQVVKRGFYLTCRNCGTPAWHPLLTIQETVICPGCSHKFPLPVEYPEGSGNEIRWEHTLNTLVNRVMDQDALPAILVIHHLTKDLVREKQACCIVPGLELVQSGDVKAELDFIFVSNQELFAGECKAGMEIGDKDLGTARMAVGWGIDHFYFCTVKRFSDESQQRIEGLSEELKSNGIDTEIGVLEGDDLLGEAID